MLGRLSCLAAIEEDVALLIPPDEMAETVYVSDPAPPMGMQRHDVSRWYPGMNNSNPLVF
jgi:hypothetical protein